jgi:hypothetical protein
MSFPSTLKVIYEFCQVVKTFKNIDYNDWSMLLKIQISLDSFQIITHVSTI